MARKSRGSGKPYDVGYGKPPTDTRFQKGESGNRRGRPPTKQQDARPAQIDGVLAAFLEAANMKVDVEFQGTTRRVSAERAMALTLIDAALDGDTKATRLFIEWTRNAQRARAELPKAQDLALAEEVVELARAMHEAKRGAADEEGTPEGAAEAAASAPPDEVDAPEGDASGAVKSGTECPTKPEPAMPATSARDGAGTGWVAPDRPRGRGEPLITDRRPLPGDGYGVQGRPPPS